MRMLQALTRHLIERAGLRRERMGSFVDEGELDLLAGEDLGHGVTLGRMKYTGTISIENFRGDAHLLSLIVMGWLNDNDPNREMNGCSQPEMDVEDNFDESFEVQIAVQFDEPLQMVPDPDGPITFNGQNWRVAEVPIDVAEDLQNFDGGPEVKTTPEEGAAGG